MKLRKCVGDQKQSVPTEKTLISWD